MIGFGRARIIDDEREKKAGLDVIMAHYGGQGGEYDEKSLQRTCVIEVVIESMTGKQSLDSPSMSAGGPGVPVSGMQNIG